MARQKTNKAKSGKGRGRKSKAESMTGAAENTVEMRKGELELKPVQIDDGDFDMHYRSSKNAKERMETATSLYRSCIKAAKKVSDELADSVKRALKFDGMDREAIKRQLEIDGYVLKKTGSSVQLTIHDALLGDVNVAAYERGKNDALNGRGCNCPYPESSTLADEYNTGWRNGIGANLGLTEAQTEAAVSDDNSGIGHNSEAVGPEDEEEPRPPEPGTDDGNAPVPIKEPEFAD